MDANGVQQVSQGATGVHLSWTGPSGWVYAPAGFTVQRRVAERLGAVQCERFDAAQLAHLFDVREQPLGFGVITLSVPSQAGDSGGIVLGPPGSLSLFRIDFAEPRRLVRGTVGARVFFTVGYSDGRVVAVCLPQTDPGQYSLRAPRIDRVEIIALAPKSLEICVSTPEQEEAIHWTGATTVVSGLTLPLRELRPDLLTAVDELEEARRRMLPGETIGAEEFRRLAAVLRPMVLAGALTRPAELAILLREGPDQDVDEARGLDPLRMALAHPTWRRAVGLGLFDDDPDLVPGETYEYRISATYPAADLRDPAYGFATVPSGTLLPADFAIGPLRVRLPRPTPVQLTPDTSGIGQVSLSRRGIALNPARESFWLHPSLEEWSLVLDFPAPVSEIVLDLAEGHDLVVASGPATGGFEITSPVPAGSQPLIVLPTPADQVRLRGVGFLHGLRLVTGTDEKTEASVVLAPIILQDTPLPAAPRVATVVNLQKPVIAGPNPAAEVAARHSLGFRVFWEPSLAFGLPGWIDQLDVAAPLEATTFQVERRAEPDGGWVPVHEDGNHTLGERGRRGRDLVLTPGADLLEAFPDSAVRTTGTDCEFTLLDAFAHTDEAGTDDLPVPGTMHRYRVRAVDAIGRAGIDWRETEAVRLEKHRPPPLPIAVEARVLVRDAEDLTPEERVLLGTSGTAILLRWKWTAEQRAQDPFAVEFRIYAAPPLDRVAGTLASTTTISTAGLRVMYKLILTLERAVTEDLAVGGHMDAGHPFLIRSHTAGTTIEMIVETRLRLRDGTIPTPVAGPIELAVPLNPDRTRPDSWDERVEVQPIGPATSYEAVLRDRLLVDQDTPVAALWVGVSAADDQHYVLDQRAPAETRPGNESAVVPAQTRARYAGRPTLEIPPPLEPVPQLRTPEPGEEPLHFPLDLTPHLPAGATVTGRVRVERVSAVALASALTVTSDDRVMAMSAEPDEPDVEIPVTNPVDRILLVAALRSGRTTEIPDRFLVHLSGHHPYRDRLFAPAREEPVVPGPFAETLPPAAERWLYRVRAIDRAGRVSAGSATARVVVRVPSLLPGAPAAQIACAPGDPPDLLRVVVPADPSLTHMLIFHTPVTGLAPLPGPVGGGAVVRVPNRPDLLPASGIWLRAPSGELLAPTATPLDGLEVVTGPDGERGLAVTVPGGPGAQTRVWLATLTRDGVCSLPTGPFTIIFPPPPLPVPMLSVTGPGPRFGWQWPPGVEVSAALLVALERTVAGQEWSRVSPLLDPLSDGVTARQSGTCQYRLRVSAPDGRVTHSEPVTVS